MPVQLGCDERTEWMGTISVEAPCPTDGSFSRKQAKTHKEFQLQNEIFSY